MIVYFHRNFKKELGKLSKKHQTQFSKKLEIFYENPFDPILNNHSLFGQLKNARSINVTGDIRTVYEQINKDTVLFLKIGSHSELYD